MYVYIGIMVHESPNKKCNCPLEFQSLSPAVNLFVPPSKGEMVAGSVNFPVCVSWVDPCKKGYIHVSIFEFTCIILSLPPFPLLYADPAPLEREGERDTLVRKVYQCIICG